MPDPIYCPDCRQPRRPREESGELLCPECATILAPDGSVAGEPAVAMAPGASALDEIPSNQARPTGAMTLLRNNLRSEESYKQNGWLENLLPRRGKGPTEPESPPTNRGQREPEVATTGKKPPIGSSRPIPRTADEPSKSAPMVVEKAARLPIAEPTPPGQPEGADGGRVSILAVLTIVVVCATASVALLRGMAAWSSVLFLLTIGLLGVSSIGILHRRQARRAFWQGYAVFGCGYLFMAFAPSFPHQGGLELPTSRLVRLAHATATASAEDPRDSFRIMAATPGVPSDRPASAGIDGPSPRPASMVLAWGDIGQFMIVGHCLFTLLAALIGSTAARWFYRSNLAFP